MKNLCFLDIESQRLSSSFPDGWGFKVPHFLDPTVEFTESNIFNMGFGLAVTYDNQYVKYWDNPEELLVYLLSSEVDGICTFNGERFDLNLLLGSLEPPTIANGICTLTEGFKEIYGMFAGKSIDVLVYIEQTLGHRVSLDQLTSGMFNRVKQEKGGETFWPKWTGNNIKDRTDAINYLMQDVVDLYLIYGVATACGKLAYLDRLGNKTSFAIKLPTVEEVGQPF